MRQLEEGAEGMLEIMGLKEASKDEQVEMLAGSSMEPVPECR